MERSFLVNVQFPPNRSIGHPQAYSRQERGYKLNVFSDHNNLVYAATVSEQSQRVMRWRLILEEFGRNTQHIAGINYVVADMLSRVPLANND
jgi:hypothetical protein